MNHPSNVIVFYTKEKYLIVRERCMILEKQLLEVTLAAKDRKSPHSINKIWNYVNYTYNYTLC